MLKLRALYVYALDFHRLYILKTLVCFLFLIFLGYSFKLRWMFHKLYGSGNYSVLST